MTQETRMLSRSLAIALMAIMLIGCTRAIIPSQSPDAVLSSVPSLSGEVSFAQRTTQAEMTEVATSATVSLIEAATNVTIASSVTDEAGRFSLDFGPTFKPDKTKAYFLEAVKGLSVGGDSNRAGASLARVRTLVYWRSGHWKSLTRQGVIVNRSTTALSIIANLRAAASLAVNLEELIASVNVGVPDRTVTPETPDTFAPAQSQIAKMDFHQVHALVTDAIARDTDPLFAISMDLGPPLRFLQTAQGFDLLSVTPASGGSQDLLTFSGAGFDPLPANNVVRFNGWRGTVVSVGADRRTMTVRPPLRLGLSGATSLQIGGIAKAGPVWTQTGWHAPFDDLRDFKSLVNTRITAGGLHLDGSNSLGLTDTTQADFDAGIRSGFAQVVVDPIDGGDGAISLQINPLRVLQVFPDGYTQIAAAQGVYNYRPDLFNFETLAVTQYNTLTTLDDTFTATVINKSGTTPPAMATIGDPVTRKLRDYDLLYFGVADSYGSKDLTATSAQLTRSFATLGRGVVFTHDTLPNGKTHFMSLSDIHGIAGFTGNPPIAGRTTVYQAPGIDTTSPIMTRPFNLSGLTSMQILNSHWSSHSNANGATVWYVYDTATPSSTPYWTTMTTAQSNAAFFSYGHTPNTPAEYEAKAMINSMYYTFDRGSVISANFTSRPLDSQATNFAWKDTPFSWVAKLPSAVTSVTFQVAATNDPVATALTYVGPDGTSNTSFTAPGAVLPTLTGRYLRYRATLSTNSIAEVPVLSRVDIGSTFSTATSVALEPNALTAWMAASFVATPAGGLRLQILDKNGVLIPDATLPGNSQGFASSPVDLSGIPANSYRGLRLRLVLLKQGSESPVVDSTTLTWTP